MQDWGIYLLGTEPAANRHFHSLQVVKQRKSSFRQGHTLARGHGNAVLSTTLYTENTQVQGSTRLAFS